MPTFWGSISLPQFLNPVNLAYLIAFLSSSVLISLETERKEIIFSRPPRPLSELSPLRSD